MENLYRIYAKTMGPNSSNSIERMSGCDGVHHAVLPIRIYFGKDKTVEHAESLPVEQQGLCDKSCGPENLGSFLFP